MLTCQLALRESGLYIKLGQSGNITRVREELTYAPNVITIVRSGRVKLEVERISAR